MLSFENDYNVGAHPKILEALLKTNLVPQTGYGFDEFTEAAKEKIRAACEAPNADVFFLVGGTQTNMIAISALLKAYEGVIAAKTGHVSLHEAGAIEHSGHKVLEVEGVDGKVTAAEVKALVDRFYADESHEHMVFPGMVYISHPTELGTLYSEKELRELSEICRAYELPLFMDGARLGYGLVSREAQLTLPMIAELCDAFYIGGTKVGALCGEALVFPKGNMPKHFLAIAKQKGGLLAKGRLTGVQFDALFTDDLYFEISRNAIDRAEEMKEVFREKGYRFWRQSPTNQQYFVLENEAMEELKNKVAFSFWENYDEEHTVVRFVTSWATTKEDIEKLKEFL